MMKFFDLDGVIIDSIKECYEVSKQVFFNNRKFYHNPRDYKRLFFHNRGLVRPAGEYMVLHQTIEEFLNSSTGDFESLFQKKLKSSSKKDLDSFEKDFFIKRLEFQNSDMELWLELNPLTSLGKLLSVKKISDISIITTKNQSASEVLLSHYGIHVDEIFSNNQIKSFGTKGRLISYILDKREIDKALFLDDSAEHLDTVDDKRVDCFFADWGYGKNTNFKVFDMDFL